METKSETKVEYDDRRKVLIQTINSTSDIKDGEEIIGDTVIKRVASLSEKGIKNVLKDLNAQKEVFTKNVEQLRELQAKVKLNSEQEKLKEDLKILQLENHQANAKEEVLKKEVKDLKANEDGLKEINKNIKDIKEAIGSRLKI